MSILAIENHTKVKTPSGYEGRVEITRRERLLISDGKDHKITVVMKNGLRYKCNLNDLEEVHNLEEVEE